MGGGGDNVSVPGPSPEELENLRLQNEALRRQAQLENYLTPVLLTSAGVTPAYDDKGNIVGFQQRPKTEAELAQERITTLSAQRAEQALAGNLPVSPGVTQDLAEQERTLGETLRKRLGPGWQTSTPGIETLAKFGKSKEAILDAARRGDISQYEAMALTSQESQNQQMRDLFSRIAGVPSFNSVAGTQGALSYYNQLRQLGLNANIANANQISPWGSILGGVAGTMAGSMAGGIGSTLGKTIGTKIWGV